MYPGDRREAWPPGILTDARVTHYWDQQQAIGKLLLAQLPAMLDRRAPATMQPFDEALWDAFFLYTARDVWEARAAPPLPVTWGYPIMVTHDTLASQLRALR